MMKVEALTLLLCLIHQGKYLKLLLFKANAQATQSYVGTQAFIWVPIILSLILIAMLCMMAGMDADKNRDTILYAKFITNVKDK